MKGQFGAFSCINDNGFDRIWLEYLFLLSLYHFHSSLSCQGKLVLRGSLLPCFNDRLVNKEELVLFQLYRTYLGRVLGDPLGWEHLMEIIGTHK